MQRNEEEEEEETTTACLTNSCQIRRQSLLYTLWTKEVAQDAAMEAVSRTWLAPGGSGLSRENADRVAGSCQTLFPWEGAARWLGGLAGSDTGLPPSSCLVPMMKQGRFQGADRVA